MLLLPSQDPAANAVPGTCRGSVSLESRSDSADRALAAADGFGDLVVGQLAM